MLRMKVRSFPSFSLGGGAPAFISWKYSLKAETYRGPWSVSVFTEIER